MPEGGLSEHFFVGEAGALGVDYVAAVGEIESGEEVLHIEVVVVGVDFYAMHAAPGCQAHHLFEIFGCHALAFGFVGYGEAVSHGDFVCLSEQTGLTCWDTASGVGAFMSREKTELF